MKLKLIVLLLVLVLINGCTYYMYKEDIKEDKLPTQEIAFTSSKAFPEPGESNPVTLMEIKNYMDLEVEHICSPQYSYQNLLEKYQLSSQRIKEITSSPLYSNDIKRAIIHRAEQKCPNN
ncbi:MAG: hypothetical protein ABIB71_09020 [Candidatus Woesearchaeota archaeon]